VLRDTFGDCDNEGNLGFDSFFDRWCADWWSTSFSP
jgi:hypothetical protein